MTKTGNPHASADESHMADNDTNSNAPETTPTDPAMTPPKDAMPDS